MRRSLKDCLKNLNLAEVADQDEWQLATLGLAVDSNDAPQVNAMLDQVLGMLVQFHELELLDSETGSMQL